MFSIILYKLMHNRKERHLSGSSKVKGTPCTIHPGIRLPIPSSYLFVALAKSRLHRYLVAASHWFTAKGIEPHFLTIPAPYLLSPFPIPPPTCLHPVPPAHSSLLLPYLRSTFLYQGALEFCQARFLFLIYILSCPFSLLISFQVNLSDYMQCTAAMLRHQLSFHLEAWRKDYH